MQQYVGEPRVVEISEGSGTNAGRSGRALEEIFQVMVVILI